MQWWNLHEIDFLFFFFFFETLPLALASIRIGHKVSLKSSQTLEVLVVEVSGILGISLVLTKQTCPDVTWFQRTRVHSGPPRELYQLIIAGSKISSSTPLPFVFSELKGLDKRVQEMHLRMLIQLCVRLTNIFSAFVYGKLNRN